MGVVNENLLWQRHLSQQRARATPAPIIIESMPAQAAASDGRYGRPQSFADIVCSSPEGREQ